MKTLIAFVLLIFTAAPLAADPTTDEEVEQLTADTLEHTDANKDGVISLAEQQDRLEAFYVSFGKAGKRKDKQDTVREDFPSLLTLQQYLAADLDDDGFVDEKELKRLFACIEPLDLWTLADADIELLVDDFILRIRKGAKAYPDDSLRKVPGKGRTKAEKLVDQASPYRAAVNSHVFGARVNAAIIAQYTQTQLSSKFDKEGRTWQICVYHNGHHGSGFGYGFEVVSKDKKRGSAGSIDVVDEQYPEGYQLPIDAALKGYGEKPAVTKVKLKVIAGPFDCDYFEIKSLGLSTRIWVMSDHPGILVKQVTPTDGDDRVVELISYKD